MLHLSLQPKPLLFVFTAPFTHPSANATIRRAYVTRQSAPIIIPSPPASSHSTIGLLLTRSTTKNAVQWSNAFAAIIAKVATKKLGPKPVLSSNTG